MIFIMTSGKMKEIRKLTWTKTPLGIGSGRIYTDIVRSTASTTVPHRKDSHIARTAEACVRGQSSYDMRRRCVAGPCFTPDPPSISS